MAAKVLDHMPSQWHVGISWSEDVKPHQVRAIKILESVQTSFDLLPPAFQTMIMMQLREYVYCSNKDCLEEHSLTERMVADLGEAFMENSPCLDKECIGLYKPRNGQTQDFCCNICGKFGEVKTRQALT